VIRCVVADDSPTFRAVMRRILAGAAGVEVVAEAADGHEAVQRAVELRPDVVTLDVGMPRLDGLAALAEIMERAPTPVIVVSAHGPDSQAAFDALRLGAVEVLAKPSAAGPRPFEAQADAIREAVTSVKCWKPVTRFRRVEGPGDRRAEAPRRPPQAGPSRTAAVVGIVASTGGPVALARILRPLGRDYPLPILVVQHIATGFDAGFAGWLAGETRLAVRLAAGGERPAPGTVYVAPDGRHLVISGGRLRLDDSPAVKGFKPSGSVLLSSLAREHGPRAAGLVLTGMGDDGVQGLQQLRDAGGFTAAQGPASSVVYGMPRVALESGAASMSVELDEAPSLLEDLAGLRAARRPGAAAP
jgi:two-component system, chemotaxis family, protein-glutamate methylesterase/glutaminase